MSESPAPKPAAPTFESGARAMNEALQTKGVEAYFADASDPLHKAFIAKAAVHSGPGGRPLIGEEAEKAIDSHYDTPRSGRSLAYIHVPFCETRCLYCMFYQNPWKEAATTEYAKQLVKELELWSDRAAQNAAPINALYFGGGTPTAFSPDDIRLVMGAVKKYLPLANDCEITLEGRIHNFSDAKMDAAIESGVNRFSLGVQTFNTQIRQSVMRVDDRDTIIRRLDKLCSYNNASVVCDMIYGFPGQTMEVWEDDLKTAASLHLDGVDCYQLNVFEKSPLARYIANGKLPRAATSDEKADFFAKSVEYFTSQNWRRLSNNHWGRTIRERNIYNAWGKSACDCLAFGCGAGGRLAGHSYMMERKLADYYRLLGEGRKPVAFAMAPTHNWHLLRTISSEMESGAINLKAIGRQFGGLPLEDLAKVVLSQWCEAGLLVKRGDWYYQTVAGQYWHVTLAQLLMDFLSHQLPEPESEQKMDMGAPDSMMKMASAGHQAHGQMPPGILKMLEGMPRDMIIEMAKKMPKEMITQMVAQAPKDVIERVLGEDGLRELGVR